MMFSKRKQRQAIPLGQRSFFWRQMATNGEFRAWTVLNFWKWPWVKLNYRRKATWSHVAPVLVVGRNTWVNAWVAYRLSKANENVWVWDVEGLDWWNYSVLNSSGFLSFCKNKLPFVSFQTVYTVLKWVRQQACDACKITVLPKGYAPVQIHQDDFTKGWVFKLSKGVWPEMEGRRASESSRRFAKTQLDMVQWPDSAERALWPQKECENMDDEMPCHYLLASRVVWTTLPPKGVEIIVQKESSWMNFDFANQETFGCAKTIAQTPETFLEQPFRELEQVLEWDGSEKS